MASSSYATSYEETTTSTQYSTTQTVSTGVIDRLYIKSIPGILKLVEMALGLLAFLIVVSCLWPCGSLSGANGFFDFAAVLCLVTTAIFYVLMVFKLHLRVCKCSCIFWPLVEMSYLIGACALLCLADCILSAAAPGSAHLSAGVAFGWFTLGAYIVDLVFAIIAFRKSRTQSTNTTYRESTTTATARY